MRSRSNKSSFIKTVGVILAVAIMLVPSFSLFGCSLFFRGLTDAADFTRKSLTVTVGDSYDLSDIIESNTSDYTLTSSDSEIAEISGNILTALKAGKAVIKAKTSSHTSELKVTVTEGEQDSLTIETTGELIQTLGSVSEVSFKPIATGNVANRNIDWYVDGEKVDTLSASEEFTYTPTAAGEHTVSAVSRDITATATLRAYYEVTATAAYSGEISQHNAPYTDITLSVDIQKNSLNPADYVRWVIDGETMYEGVALSYTYNPTPGRHTISVFVNGVARSFAGGDTTLDIVIVGSIQPSAPTFVFDNLYPHAYVKYEAEGYAQVEITSPSGSIAEYAQTDPQYSALFDEDGFDVGGLISVCAEGPSCFAYRFRVKSLGDGGALGESEYSPYITFTQVPSAAKTYLQTRYLDKDLYITSDEEYVAALEYYIFFRSKTTSRPKVSFSCYIAYSFTGDEEDLFDDAFELVATSGTYKNIEVQKNNNILQTSFTIDTVNNPSRQTKNSVNSNQYAKQLHAVLPHINYDRTKDRPDNYVFPIDRLKNSQTVKYGDELFLAVQNNTRPIVSVGTSAYVLYNTARKILRQICTDEMTDMQKAHAIYDWIMWQVTYDTPATELYSGGEAYSAYYLEGVFGNGSTKIGGVAYSPYAVCDGMSKAYSLMCNIEGIPCVRVAGDAGESMSEEDRGGHAWNKVFVNGAWYVVDCTWGDSTGDMTLDGRRSTYELGLHDYLFLTDAQADETHFEPFELGESSIIYAPETTTRRYNVYSDMTYNGVAIDCAITASQNITSRIRDIAAAFASAYVKRSSIYVPGGTNNGEYEITYEGLDIYVDGGINVSDSTLSSTVRSAIRSVYPSATVNVLTYDNLILILMRA